MCGVIDHWEIVTSNSRITGRNFDNAEQLPNPPTPRGAGVTEQYDLPANVKRFVAAQ